MPDTVGWILSTTVGSVSAGLAIGCLMAAVFFWSFRLLTPENPSRGLIAVFAAFVSTSLAGIGSLFMVRTLAKQAVLPYGVALVAGFMVLAVATVLVDSTRDPRK